MHTHFTMSGDRQGAWFTIDECEVCGRPVQAPNAVTHHHTRAQMLAKGFELYEGPALPEIWWDEELGCTTCERSDCTTFNAGHEADMRAELRIRRDRLWADVEQARLVTERRTGWRLGWLVQDGELLSRCYAVESFGQTNLRAGIRCLGRARDHAEEGRDPEARKELNEALRLIGAGELDQ